jgi:hypothetical protein
MKSEKLRDLSEKNQWTNNLMIKVLTGNFIEKAKNKISTVKLNSRFVSRFFSKNQSPQEITSFVETAVAFYSDYLNKISDKDIKENQ